MIPPAGSRPALARVLGQRPSRRRRLLRVRKSPASALCGKRLMTWISGQCRRGGPVRSWPARGRVRETVADAACVQPWIRRRFWPRCAWCLEGHEPRWATCLVLIHRRASPRLPGQPVPGHVPGRGPIGMQWTRRTVGGPVGRGLQAARSPPYRPLRAAMVTLDPWPPSPAMPRYPRQSSFPRLSGEAGMRTRRQTPPALGAAPPDPARAPALGPPGGSSPPDAPERDNLRRSLLNGGAGTL